MEKRIYDKRDRAVMVSLLNHCPAKLQTQRPQWVFFTTELTEITECHSCAGRNPVEVIFFTTELAEITEKGFLIQRSRDYISITNYELSELFILHC